MELCDFTFGDESFGPNSPTCSELAPPTAILNQENIPQVHLQGSLMEVFSHLKFLLRESSSDTFTKQNTNRNPSRIWLIVRENRLHSKVPGPWPQVHLEGAIGRTHIRVHMAQNLRCPYFGFCFCFSLTLHISLGTVALLEFLLFLVLI